MILKRISIALFVVLYSMNAKSQWNNKHGFCGAALKKWQLKAISPQAAFLHLSEKDTVADIGAASGWFEGAIACASPVERMHFVLVDLDSSCLNREKLANMARYYSHMKGRPVNYTYDIVINSNESLFLPNQGFTKILVRNTLHEVANQQQFGAQLSAATKKGGNLYIIEVLPTKKKKYHGGCHMPLLTFAEINDLFEKNGFLLKEKQQLRLKKHVSLQMLRFSKQ
jgi:hypothetical protein